MRMPISKIVVVLFLGALTLSGCPSKSSDSEPPVVSVSLSPSAATVSQGTTFTRTVEVQNVGDTYSAGFDLTYDPNVVEYIDTTEGSFLNRNGSDSTVFKAVLWDDTPGRVVVGVTRLGQIGEVSGTGTLLTFSFKAVGPGTTTLAFENPKVLENSAHHGVRIDAWEGATITVQ